MKKTISVVLTVVCLQKWVECNKFDIPDMNAHSPFRMGKINLIWDKAKRAKVLNDKRMAELFAELTLQDKKQRELKEKLMDNTDRDGLFEAEVRKDLADVLSKYSLQEHFPKDNYKPDDKNMRNRAYALKDENLKNLMNDAGNEGFTAQEIQTLQQELGHHQMKLDEFYALKDEYKDKHDKVDNSLENFDEQDALWQELQAKNLAMKQKHQQLKSDFQKLKLKTKKQSMSEFEDPRVIHLWALAQKSGIGGEELESIRKELTHFEHRIMKTQYMKDEVDRRKGKIQRAQDFDTEHLERAQRDMQERAAHYEAMVEKHHADIKNRIQKRIDEL